MLISILESDLDSDLSTATLADAPIEATPLYSASKLAATDNLSSLSLQVFFNYIYMLHPIIAPAMK